MADGTPPKPRLTPEQKAEAAAEKAWREKSTKSNLRTRPEVKKARRSRREVARLPANHIGLVEEAAKLLDKKNGRNSYLTDGEIIGRLCKQFRIDTPNATLALKGAKDIIAERINTLAPTLGQNVISDLQETVREAKKVGDLGTAGRCLIALGRFAGLDQPKPDPQAQVRQLSDAALEASIAAAVARKLEYMPQDQFEDLMRRREEARIRGAKLLAPDAPLLGMPKEPIEAENREAAP
mgnify:CR=1 FL=1